MRGSQPNRPGLLGATFADQLLFSLGGFVVSLAAAREFSAGDLALFAVLWQWALGAISLSAEAVIAPAIVHFSGATAEASKFERRTADPLIICAGFVLAIAAALSAIWPEVATVAAVIAVAISGVAFSVVRGIRYAVGSVGASATRSALRLGLTLAVIGIAVGLSIFSVQIALLTGALGFLVAALPQDFPPREGINQLIAAVRPFLHEASWYTAATGFRIVGYSVGLILLTSWVRGTDDAAVVAGILILAGPTQLVSSSLPMLFMAELGGVRTDGWRFRRLLFRQSAVMIAVLGVGLTVAAFVFRWWVEFTIGDIEVRQILLTAFVPFALLVAGIALASWIAGALKALRRPRMFTIITLLSGAASLLAVFTPASTAWLAAIPYAVVGVTMAWAVLVTTSPGPRREFS